VETQRLLLKYDTTHTKIVSVSVFSPQQIKIFFVFSIFPVEAFRFSFWIIFLSRFGSTEVFRFEATLDTQERADIRQGFDLF
jgi:hypothetical protein